MKTLQEIEILKRDLIKKYLGEDSPVHLGSAMYFAETRKVGGNLFIKLKQMLEEYANQFSQAPKSEQEIFQLAEKEYPYDSKITEVYSIAEISAFEIMAFIKGYKAALSSPIEVDKWVRVEDRTPKQDKYEQEILFGFFSDNKFIMCYGFYLNGNFYDFQERMQPIKATHWQPLPEIPKEK